MACASFSSHLSLVRSMSYSRANQSSVKRLVVTSLVSHVTTRLIVVSSTINALICTSSPPFLTCSCIHTFPLLRIVVRKAACLPYKKHKNGRVNCQGSAARPCADSSRPGELPLTRENL